MEKKKNKFYAVARGRNVGIFSAWFGTSGAEAQIKGFAGARYKGFTNIDEARQWLEDARATGKPVKKTDSHPEKASDRKVENILESGGFVIYTDGGCSRNPGPGGYGAVVLKDKTRKEISGGFRLTTNNRMELMACIAGLRALKSKSAIKLYSDSRYVVNGIAKGWAKKWRSNNWMRTKTEAAENYDLWKQLLELCEMHILEFVWVKGHAGNQENECCDRLATKAAAGKDLPRDSAYENGTTKLQS
jgi:ribonuclease HI